MRMRGGMDDLGDELARLARTACRYPPGHVERQKALTRIVALVRPKLWQDNAPHYADALQRTWIYFCQNICEEAGNTGQAYDPDRSSIVTWLNAYLKRRLQDFEIETYERRNRFATPRDRDYVGRSPLERVASPPEIPPILERVTAWVKEDITGDLRRTHVRDRPDINAQVLIVRRLPPETGWKELAAEFDISVSTLSSFYQRHCMPRLRAFGQSEGFL
ncbi:MAG: sigma-70 family RNA polymerase sigma factor [Cyanobacteria bacterium J06639_1]